MNAVKDAAYIGFRIIEIPLGLVRKMVESGQYTGAQQLVNAHPFEDDLTAVAINEFNNSMYLVTNPDGRFKRLTKAN